MYLLVGIDTRDEPLACCFFVAGGPVDLTSEEEACDDLALERMVQLCGVEEVVLDGVAWAIEAHITQCRDLAQGLELHL